MSFIKLFFTPVCLKVKVFCHWTVSVEIREPNFSTLASEKGSEVTLMIEIVDTY